MIRLRQCVLGMAVGLLMLSSLTIVHADDDEPVFVEHPVAVLAFRERGDEVKGMGAQAADLLFAQLVTRPSLYLVERDELEKSLAEQELNLSGIVNPSEAVQVGQLTGAKIIVTGSVLQVDNKLYVIAKIMGTETSRVLGASATGNTADGLDALVMKLADKVAKTIQGSASKLVPKPLSKTDRLAALNERLGDAKRPVVSVVIDEQHVGRPVIDPAAQTEMTIYCERTGFVVLDPDAANAKQADVLIKGEGISEFAARRGDLISVKARLEVKAVNRESGEIVAIDRQTSVAVDLSEQLAGKKALERAAAAIAVRMLPKLVTAAP